MAQTTLKIGSTGQAVKDLQKKLGIKADGIFGAQTQAAVKSYQKSSGLTSDGIVGAKTQGSLSGGSSGSTTNSSKPSTNKSTPTKSTTNSSKPIQTTQASSYKSTSSKSPMFANPFSGGFFNNLKGGVKSVGTSITDAINTVGKKTQGASAMDFNVGTGLTKEEEQIAYNTLGSTNSVTPTGLTGFGGRNEQVPTTVKSEVNIASPTGLVDANGLPVEVPQMGEAPVDINSALDSGGLTSDAGTETTLTKETINPLTGETTTYSQSSPLGSESNLGGTNNNMNYNAISDASKNAQLALKIDIGDATWRPNTTNNSEFQSGQLVKYADNFAKGFTTQQEATSYLNSPAGKQATADFVAKGGKIQDIINKVQPVTNGLVGEQTVDQFLLNTKGIPSTLKAEADIINKNIIDNFQWTDAQKKYLDNDVQGEVLGLLQQTQKESDERVRLLNLQAFRKETSEREKSDILVQKARNQFDSDNAKLEQNRIKARNSMIGLLAKIGALDTTSGSGFALEEVESKYEQMQQDLRGSFTSTMNEIEYNMNTKINEFQEALDDKVFEINQDLSKTERDVRMEKMKLNQQFKKDVNAANLDLAKEIMAETRRVNDKAEANAIDNIEKIRLLMSGGADYKEATKLVSGKNYASDEKSLTRVNELLSKKDTDQAAIADLQELDLVLGQLKGDKRTKAITEAKKMFLKDFPSQNALFNSYIGS